MTTYKIIEEGPFPFGGVSAKLLFFTRDHEPCEESESDYAYYEERDQSGNICYYRFLGTEQFDPYKDILDGMEK